MASASSQSRPSHWPHREASNASESSYDFIVTLQWGIFFFLKDKQAKLQKSQGPQLGGALEGGRVDGFGTSGRALAFARCVILLWDHMDPDTCTGV